MIQEDLVFSIVRKLQFIKKLSQLGHEPLIKSLILNIFLYILKEKKI